MKTTKSSAASLLSLAIVAAEFSGGADAQTKTSDYIKQHAPQGISANFYACVDQARGTVETGACLSAEKERQDQRLNTVYKKLLGALPEKDRAYLVAAERAWVALTDKDAALETVVYGNEQVDNLQQGQNEIFRLCERANTLQRYLDLVKDK